MNHASNRRALDCLLQKRRKKHNPWLEAVFASDRETRAALALAEVAQILAGTEKIKAARFAASSVGSTTEAAPGVDHPPPRNRRPVWSKTVRPGPHDVLTWDEAMQVPWIEGSAEAE